MIAVLDKLLSLRQLKKFWNEGIKPNEIDPIWDELNTQRVALLFSAHDLAAKTVTVTKDSDGYIASMSETSADATMVTTYTENVYTSILTPSDDDYIYTRITTFNNDGTVTETYSAQAKTNGGV